jgi:hypothetical protein
LSKLPPFSYREVQKKSFEKDELPKELQLFLFFGELTPILTQKKLVNSVVEAVSQSTNWIYGRNRMDSLMFSKTWLDLR